jgi:hypothetical protein
MKCYTVAWDGGLKTYYKTAAMAKGYVAEAGGVATYMGATNRPKDEISGAVGSERDHRR